jgi:hypothetical protein
MNSEILRNGPKRRRPNAVTVRFTDEEFAAVENATNAAQMPASEWLRKAAIDACDSHDERLSIRLILEDMQFLKAVTATSFKELFIDNKCTAGELVAMFREINAIKKSSADTALRSAKERKQ